MRKIGKDGVFSVNDDGTVSCKGYIVEGAAQDTYVKADGGVGIPSVGGVTKRYKSKMILYRRNTSTFEVNPNHDTQKLWLTTNPSNVTVNVHSYPAFENDYLAEEHFLQATTGQLNFVPAVGSGVTILTAETTKTRKIGSKVTLTWIGATDVLLTGDLEKI